MSLSIENESSSHISPWHHYRSAKGAKEHLQFCFADITEDLNKWTRKSAKHSIEILDLKDHLEEINQNQPKLKNSSLDFNVEIVLIYQNKMRRYLLCEMIRRYMVRYIENLYQGARHHFEGQLAESNHRHHYQKEKIQSKLNLVDQCHRFLLKQVPAEVTLLLVPEEYEEKVEEMKHQYRFIKAKANEMKSKLTG